MEWFWILPFSAMLIMGYIVGVVADVIRDHGPVLYIAAVVTATLVIYRAIRHRYRKGRLPQ